MLRASTAADAKRIVLGLVPDGSHVYHGASQTLESAGITDEIEKSGRYEAIRPRIWSMDRATQADEIRQLTASPEVMLGSVHAVTESGSLMTASMGQPARPLRQWGRSSDPRGGNAEDRDRP